MRELAKELKTDDDAVPYADRMAQELADLFQAEEDRAAKEIERRQVRGGRHVLVELCTAFGILPPCLSSLVYPCTMVARTVPRMLA